MSSDHDFLAIGDAWLAVEHPCGGIVVFNLLLASIGGAMSDLLLVATAAEPADLADRVVFLPL